MGKSLVTAGNFSEFGEKKVMANYNEEDGEQEDDERFAHQEGRGKREGGRGSS